MKRALVFALALVAVVPAHAGERFVTPLHIIVEPDGSGFFMGTLGDTRASSDAVSNIGCEISGSSSGAAGTCFALDTVGHSVSCHFTAPALIQAASSVNATSRLQVAWDKTRTCTFIVVTNWSLTQPIAP